MTIRIILADDHGVLRDGLKSLLSKEEKYQVIGEAYDGREALELCRELNPDLVLMDISMPKLNGIDATIKIKDFNSNIKVIALSVHNRKQFVLDMLAAKASGFILKSDLYKDISFAIDAVMAGGTYISPKLTSILTNEILTGSLGTNEQKKRALAPREREVLQMVSEGLSTKEIAKEIDVSVKTIEATRHRIMEKLDIHSIAGLTKYALSIGLTRVDFQ